MYYLGIDVSKSKADYLILDSQGERLQKAFSLENNKEDFQSLARRLEELNLTPENLLSGIEATGNLLRRTFIRF